MSEQPVTCALSKPAASDFLSGQRNLVIFLKDGYSFFKANAELLTQRLADPSKRTTLIIVHPDSLHLKAIADMDPHKAGKPEVQQSDCQQAVRLLHEIRANLKTEYKGDCAERTTFIGHDLVPTWNGFVGDELAIVNLYPTRSYRGPLVSFTAFKDGENGADILYVNARTDCEEIVREAGQNARSNLWNYAL
jgi:hypothetical protein